MTKDTPQIYQRDTPNKKPDKPLPAAKFSEPITKGVIEDSEGDDSAEEEIVTAGARATLNNSPPRRVAPRPNVSFETHHLPGDPPSEDESSELESESDQLETPGAEPQEELNEITRYRAALEIIYRRKWREYNKAGNARWKLQQVLHHLKRRPLTKPFYKYRKEQFREWKAKALKLWKRLEKTHRGILILDSTININFRQERMIHEKHLKEKPL
ncbi:hypothetical protein L207DRAFT_590586 [Hyaloscypha variabilis F]|uniref:Uncharacterized protein n=1 Tax=Hyaloscypha variabilis (strain UAMH 11265 / GT02V1 / F) TaxID=1149755 RepID=A0A2J6R195_HYAVF|nr:hypothetical protein L207DRAFT_590586 [Hyaloscypha variabilis F]